MKHLILIVLYLAVASCFAQEPEGVFLMPPYSRGVDSSKMVLIRDKVFGAFADTKLYKVVDLSSLKDIKIDLTVFYEQGKISQEVKIKLENLNCIYVLGTILTKDKDEGKIVISVKMQHISTLQLVPGKTAVGYTDYNLASIDAVCQKIISDLFADHQETKIRVRVTNMNVTQGDEPTVAQYPDGKTLKKVAFNSSVYFDLDYSNFPQLYFWTCETNGCYWKPVNVPLNKDQSDTYIVTTCNRRMLITRLTDNSIPDKTKQDPNTFTDPRDGKVYKTVKIGSQTWMAENLNVGQMIPSAQVASNNGRIEKYCYDNDPANCKIYGGLYDWDEMMGYSTKVGAQGICPPGWHIPSKSEWIDLVRYLMDDTTQHIESVWKAKVKEAGSNHWEVGNRSTNESGFSAFGGGCGLMDGQFVGLRNDASFWSSTQISSSTAYFRYLGYELADAFESNFTKTLRYSVRCLRDSD